jgi:hypothetical protein
MTSLRKQIQLDATMRKNLKLIILDNCFFATNDYRNNHLFFQDLRGILNEYKVACIFTSTVYNTNQQELVKANDMKYHIGAMKLCDTIYGIKSVKNKKKLSLWQRFLNIFRSKAKKRDGITEKGIYISVIKNRYGDSNIACKLKVNVEKLEVDLEKSS